MKEATGGRIRVLPLKDVDDELQQLIHETESTYSSHAPDSEGRRLVARRLVALSIALKAVRDLEGGDS